MIVKICGLTDPDQARGCLEAGADWLGLNFWAQSTRFVDIDRAIAIAAAARDARPDVVLVGVFVNAREEELAQTQTAVGLDRLQLHGDEPVELVERLGPRAIRALRLSSQEDLARAEPLSCTLLVDAVSPGYGGSGRVANWALASQLVRRGKEVLLAGGLQPENVAEAIGAVAPWGVDVASGVESAPGVKDLARVRAFVARAKGAQ